MTRGSPTNFTQLLSGQGTNELREIKPPVAIPTGWMWVAWVLGALILALLLYAAWRYWRKRRLQVVKVAEIPAHIRARQKLEAALSLIGNPREFCIAVSDIVRWYLEERFSFRAPERTTEEFLVELQGTTLLTDEQKLSLGRFLQSCDLVKFARYEPREPELRELHSAALQLIEQTKPAPQIAPAAGGSPPEQPVAPATGTTGQDARKAAA